MFTDVRLWFLHPETHGDSLACELSADKFSEDQKISDIETRGRRETKDIHEAVR